MENAENSEVTKKQHLFYIVGLITSEDFQKSKYAIFKLYRSFPQEFASPEIRPLLDVEWNEFIVKYQRRLGNGLWLIKNKVAIFKDGEFLGDFSDLYEFIWRKWKYVFNEDWHCLASKHLIDYLEEKIEHCRQLVYLTIAIDSHVIGSLLFELYNDIVPLTCENFLNRCNNKSRGYAGASIHRIVKNSWIQGGDCELESSSMACENYVVPHDRRGVLSMCNNGRHRNNTIQFYLTLESAPWMNYKYVAFGQLISGDDILKAIEDVPTYYQAPMRNITIVKCGEYKTKLQAEMSGALFTVDEIEQWKETQCQIDILTYLKSYHRIADPEGHPSDIGPVPLVQYNRSYDSIMTHSQLKAGAYSLKSDLKSYAPLSYLPEPDSDQDEGASNYTICGPDYPIKKPQNNKWMDDIQDTSRTDVTL
ncbi:probable inactive peptidyl-prolyl cis-trans isomerase-like 6 [Dendroctonus ponderosae]|uniref:PPIase cyclophilin-type domain-containing protein n=1 Tax=Dendroctonus ponderosae TaxID=77166 RepID=A0AAR5QBI8_DENPD|nr:probable inactive peptidyl-prolyl cis-trans isomerase-like 6 [Dendroctonus ponderosae]KAH1015649.1 hypothetical protein HUJ04_006999 [Dendroctonus ponderosae]KAH1024923.1 hypothetical protein HUJ05_009754 [Dendroctonus ponderosae]